MYVLRSISCPCVRTLQYRLALCVYSTVWRGILCVLYCIGGHFVCNLQSRVALCVTLQSRVALFV